MVKAVYGGDTVYTPRRGSINVAFAKCSIPEGPAFSFSFLEAQLIYSV